MVQTGRIAQQSVTAVLASFATVSPRRPDRTWSRAKAANDRGLEAPNQRQHSLVPPHTHAVRRIRRRSAACLVFHSLTASPRSCTLIQRYRVKRSTSLARDLRHSVLAGLVLAISGLFGQSHALADEFFKESVAPILQRRCLSCHDEQQREGSFSLQVAASAFADDYIVAGDPEASRFWEVITPVDGKAEMPKDADPLSETEREAIRKWIADGAQWPEGLQLEEAVVTDLDWWSFQPIRRPEVPEPASTAQLGDASQPTGDPDHDFSIRNPIDALVLQKLAEKGLSPAGPADRRTLLRRVTYDLIGMPPTPEEVQQFVEDPDPQAYEKWVDRLLESQHYGERWARHWLDVVKYADTCGYDKDKLRPQAWPYRDYVIRSFNNDKPFARFVQEQIAGDVLFPGEPDGILGLGFIAAGPWDFIGHVEVPESKLDGKVARNLDRDDMVSGTLNTFCSLTVQCARCHHHKFDPITQQQYYGLQAIFAAVDRAERPYDLDPVVEQQRKQLTAKVESLRSELAAIEDEIAKAGGEALTQLQQQIDKLQSELHLEKDPRFGYHSQIAADASIEKWVEVDLGAKHELAEIVLHPCHDEYAQIGAGFGFPVRFRVEVSLGSQDWQTVHDRTSADVPNPGLQPVRIALDGLPARRIRVTATTLASRQNDFIFALAELEAMGTEGANLALGKPVTSADSIEAPVRWGRSNLTDGLWAQYRDPLIAEQLTEAQREHAERMEAVETPERKARRAAAQQSLQQAQSELQALPSGRMVYAAATDFKPQGSFKPTGGQPRPIYVLARGEVSQPTDPATPGMLPIGTEVPWQLDPQAPEGERRAALARWLTDPKHPLVWRSIVNRVWLYHFGQGLVATPNDFGRMGAKPTHPELLDWLAAEFRDGGDWLSPQSIKSLHRLIVTSSVYRQASRHDPANAAIDADNRFLWRMNRRRLEAEEIRDSILVVSGAMDETMGGPGFQLFELERPEHSPHYEYHKFDPSDPATHRRSIYRFVVRSQPDPWMTTLDCADSSQSTPRREETLTSLQALSMLNSRFNLVMAELFAQRMEQESDQLEDQVRRAFQLVTQREADVSQSEQMVAYARQHGMVNLCRLLFNLSEFIYLD